MTFIAYPRLVRDCDYLYEKLKPLVMDIDRDRFREAFREISRPDWVHAFTNDDK